jgi:TRAP-type C4-dicarboxylate transport system permease large subunit
MYIFLGMFLDALAMMLLTMPIVFPIIVSLGFDPIWFGVIFVRIGEIAVITPPVGINVYVIKGVAKDVPLETIFQGIFPFLIADLINLAILVAFPQISLFIPNTM